MGRHYPPQVDPQDIDQFKKLILSLMNHIAANQSTFESSVQRSLQAGIVLIAAYNLDMEEALIRKVFYCFFYYFCIIFYFLFLFFYYYYFSSFLLFISLFLFIIFYIFFLYFLVYCLVI